MRFNKLNQETLDGQINAGVAAMRVGNKGLIYLNVPAVKQLGLKEDDKVSIFQNEDDLNEWFLILKDPKGYKLRHQKKDASLICYSASVTRSFLTALGFDLDTTTVTFELKTDKIIKDSGYTCCPIKIEFEEE